MKKAKLFSLIVAAVSLLAINAWSGACNIPYSGVTFQGVINPNNTKGSTTEVLIKDCCPATSIMDSVKVEAEFSASCTILKRTMVLLDDKKGVMDSKDFANGKFTVTLKYSPGYSAGKVSYLRVDAERTPTGLTTMCGITVKVGGKVTGYCTP
jgi:hypothetical protein